MCDVSVRKFVVFVFGEVVGKLYKRVWLVVVVAVAWVGRKFRLVRQATGGVGC